MFEGYHWENLPESEGVEHTINYCKAFVNKYVSFELGEGFTFSTKDNMQEVKVTKEGKNTFEYLESVWEDNQKLMLTLEMGQMKSVTGEGWVHVNFAPPGSFHDPFNIYDKGRIELLLLPTTAVFPDWNPHKRGELMRLLITYRYNKVEINPITKKRTEKVALYKQTWTNDKIVVDDDGEERTFINKYGTIPIVPIKNIILAGREEGQSDIEDLIPINIAYNMKVSDVSEILDYHAAPVTVVIGGKIGNLEKGANKLWGGLPKDAKVQNLELKGDLAPSLDFIEDLKQAMCDVGSMPEGALGGEKHVSNTSGIALHISQSPLVDLTKMKRNATQHGLELVNRMILYVSVIEGLINRGDINKVTNEDFYYTKVNIPDTMPKDLLIELQMIKTEMMLGLEERHHALERLGRDDIEKRLKEIDEDRKKNPFIYATNANGLGAYSGINQGVNSGMTNGETPNEMINKEIAGRNESINKTFLDAN